MKSRLKQYILIVFNVYYGILALSGDFSRPTVLESLTIIQKRIINAGFQKPLR